MNFNVSRLMQEPSGTERMFRVNEKLSLSNGPDAFQIEGEIRLLRTEKGVWISAVLDSNKTCVCSRCLDAFVQPIHMDIEEEYLAESQTEHDKLNQDLMDLEVPQIQQNQVLDMTDLITQYSFLNLPMNPICKADCRGICQDCGIDLNMFTCNCGIQPTDVRWEKLARLAIPPTTNN